MSLNLLESEKEKTIERIKSETNLSELSKSMIS